MIRSKRLLNAAFQEPTYGRRHERNLARGARTVVYISLVEDRHATLVSILRDFFAAFHIIFLNRTAVVGLQEKMSAD